MARAAHGTRHRTLRGCCGHDPGPVRSPEVSGAAIDEASVREALEPVDVWKVARPAEVARWGDLIACSLPGSGRITVVLAGLDSGGQPVATPFEIPLDDPVRTGMTPGMHSVPEFVDGLAVVPIQGHVMAIDAMARDATPTVVARLDPGFQVVGRLGSCGQDLIALAVNAGGDVQMTRIEPIRSEHGVVVLDERRPWTLKEVCSTTLDLLGVPVSCLERALPLRGRWVVPGTDDLWVAGPINGSAAGWTRLERYEERTRRRRAIEVSRDRPLQYVGDPGAVAAATTLLVPMREEESRTFGRIDFDPAAGRFAWAPAHDTAWPLIAGRDCVFETCDPEENAVVLRRVPPAGGAGVEVSIAGAASILDMLDLEECAIVCVKSFNEDIVIWFVNWQTRRAKPVHTVAGGAVPRLASRLAICGQCAFFLVLRDKLLSAVAIPLIPRGVR